MRQFLLLLGISFFLLSARESDRPIPPQGRALVKEFEGLYLTSYQDLGGVWTICWGAIGNDIKPNMTVSKTWCEVRLHRELSDTGRDILALVQVPLTDNQYSALVSFVYHEGIYTLSKSSILLQLNQSNYNAAACSFFNYSTFHGKYQAGFARRRRAEVTLYFNNDENLVRLACGNRL